MAVRISVAGSIEVGKEATFQIHITSLLSSCVDGYV